MFAFSYSVGPTVLAALQDGIRDRVRFVVGLGGYHDLPRAMRFFTTGWFEHDGQWQRITPDDTGRMVLVYSSLDYLADEARIARCSTAWWRYARATPPQICRRWLRN
jgi:hypothetical protein